MVELCKKSSEFRRYLREIISENKPLFIDKFVRLFFSLLWYVAIAYILMPDEYGILISLATFTASFFITSDMFIPCYVKWIDEKNAVLFNHLLLTVPLIVANYFLLTLYNLQGYFWFSGLALLINVFADVVRGELMAREDFRTLAIFRSLSYAVYVLASLAMAPWLRINGVLLGILLSEAVYLVRFRAFPEPRIKLKYYRLAFSGLGQALGRILNGLAEPGVLLRVLKPSELGSLYLNKKIFFSSVNVINETLGVWVQPKLSRNEKIELRFLLIFLSLFYLAFGIVIFGFYELGILSRIFRHYTFSLEYLVAFYLYSWFFALSILLVLAVVYGERIKESSVLGTIPVLVWLFVALVTQSLPGILLGYVLYGFTRFLLGLYFVFRKASSR